MIKFFHGNSAVVVVTMNTDIITWTKEKLGLTTIYVSYYITPDINVRKIENFNFNAISEESRSQQNKFFYILQMIVNYRTFKTG